MSYVAPPTDRPDAQAAPGAVRPRTPYLLAAVAVLLGVLVLSLAVGSNPLTPAQVWAALTGSGSTEHEYVVLDLRVPRTLAGIVVGMALGVAGALMQAFTRNPLADPGILGVNAGAAFLVAVGVAFGGVTSAIGYVWFALVGALVVTLAVYVIGMSGRGPADPMRLTLAGVAIGAVLSGITSGLSLSRPTTFESMRSWHAGSLLGRGLEVLLPVLPLVVLGLVIAVAVTAQLNAIALGDDVARSQGVSVTRTRGLVVVAVTLLAGSATAIAGPIAFVGLMVPHAVRWVTGPNHRAIALGSLVVAPVLVLAADVTGRLLVLPGEMPVGVVTAFIGGPVLIALVRSRKARQL